MYFNNILWNVTRRDGTRDVKVYVNLNGKVKYYSTGLKVSAEDWNERTGYVKTTHPVGKVYNAKIRALRNKVEEHFLSGGTFEGFQAEEASEKHGLVKYLARFVADGEKGMLGLKEGTLKNYRATLRRLEQFEDLTGRKFFFKDITMQFEKDFSIFLREHAACNLPGIGKHMKNIKRIMATAQDRHLHTNEEYKKFKAHKSSRSTKIFLTRSDIGLLEKLDLSNQPTLEAERDRFLLAYYFIQRFSDVIRLKRENVFYRDSQAFLKYNSQKTGQEAILPVSGRAMAILEKHAFRMGFSSNQQANREIKNICALAGINEVVTEGSRTLPKCQLVTTHTARRSAATNLYLEGASLKAIADLGGWDNIEVLRVYLRASGFDSARLAKDMEFFK